MQAPAHAMQAPAHAMPTSQWRVPWRLLQSTCHGTCHASAGTCHASASTRHAHKPLACAMAFAAEHTPQCLPWFAAHATKTHTPARKRLPKRLPKRSRECVLTLLPANRLQSSGGSLARESTLSSQASARSVRSCSRSIRRSIGSTLSCCRL
jgi:hypothetical protein